MQTVLQGADCLSATEGYRLRYGLDLCNSEKASPLSKVTARPAEHPSQIALVRLCLTARSFHLTFIFDCSHVKRGVCIYTFFDYYLSLKRQSFIYAPSYVRYCLVQETKLEN